MQIQRVEGFLRSEQVRTDLQNNVQKGRAGNVFEVCVDVGLWRDVDVARNV